MQIISLIQDRFNKEKRKRQCNMKFNILDIDCKEHLYYVNQIHLKNIMAGSFLLENKKLKLKPKWNLLNVHSFLMLWYFWYDWKKAYWFKHGLFCYYDKAFFGGFL